MKKKKSISPKLSKDELESRIWGKTHVAETSLAGAHALLVHPPAGSSPPSVRVYVAWDLAEYVWERLVETGRHRGLMPLGHDARGLLTRSAPASINPATKLRR